MWQIKLPDKNYTTMLWKFEQVFGQKSYSNEYPFWKGKLDLINFF